MATQPLFTTPVFEVTPKRYDELVAKEARLAVLEKALVNMEVYSLQFDTVLKTFGLYDKSIMRKAEKEDTTVQLQQE